MSTNCNLNKDRLKKFIQLSSELTGYKKTELWGTGMAEQYLTKVDEQLGICMTDKLLTYADDAAKLLDDNTLRANARAVIKLWYLAQWCVGPTAPMSVLFSVSPTTYTESLAWHAMGGHPPGARQQGFGSWSKPPVCIKEASE